MSMHTKVLPPDARALALASRLLQGGGLVAFPTETVYGLGAHALNGRAVESVFRVKGRPSDNPLIVHLASTDDIASVAREILPNARALMDAFMPGPLTLVLKKRSEVPDIVTAGLDTVAVRVPSHPAAAALLQRCGLPLAAPSANSSQRPSPTCAAHVLEDLGGKIPLIIDGGSCEVGIESTVVSVTAQAVTILRPGIVTAQSIADVLGGSADCYLGRQSGADGQYLTDNNPPSSPGIKYRHYAPSCECVAFFEEQAELLSGEILRRRQAGQAVGVAAYDKVLSGFEYVKTFSLGESDRDAASRLFAVLRQAEKQCDVLFLQAPGGSGIAQSVLNRVQKACSGNFFEA